MTSGAALAIVNREAGNALPSLGYTGASDRAQVTDGEAGREAGGRLGLSSNDEHVHAK
jgi:hypothetical protein